jgi:acyl-homoserine lactone synthase
MQVVTARAFDGAERLLDSMFADRKAVFVDLLGWEVPHDERAERDEFDNDEAEYLVVTEQGTSDHLASLRMLRTDRPHILGSLFPELCEGVVPAAPDIREVSRICLSPRHRGSDRWLYRDLLATAMTEYALLMGIRAYTAVSEMGRLSRVLSAGWRCEPLGMPRKIGRTMVGALMIYIEPDTIRRLQAFGRYHPGALRLEERAELAA